MLVLVVVLVLDLLGSCVELVASRGPAERRFARAAGMETTRR